MRAPNSPVVDAARLLLQAHRRLRDALLAEDALPSLSPEQYPEEHRRRTAHVQLDAMESALLELADLYEVCADL